MSSRAEDVGCVPDTVELLRFIVKKGWFIYYLFFIGMCKFDLS